MNILKNIGKYTVCTCLATMLLFTSVTFGLGYEATVIAPETVIRQEKAFDSQQLDKLDMGTKVIVEEISDGWYCVEAPDGRGKGWVSSGEMVMSNGLPEGNSLKRGDVTTDVLNVRPRPSTDYTRITQIRRGDTVTIINTSDTPEKWYEVILNNNIKGWVHSDYIKITYNLPKGVISVDSTVLGQEPKSDTACVAKLKKDETVYIKDYTEGWYSIITSEDIKGWVESKHIKVLLIDTPNVNRSGSGREVFNDIETITSKYLGKKYVYGGNGPNGFDCSGFTSYILKTYYGEYLKTRGINLPRTASAQATVGVSVGRENLQKGDLVFFDTVGRIGDNIGHVGIYLGNGQMIHASTSRGRIVTDKLSDQYYATRFMKAVRL